jgi:hypothetical protein
MQHWVSLHTLADLMFIDHAFDEYVSSKISLNRSLPDRRNRHHFLKPKNMNKPHNLKGMSHEMDWALDGING